MKTVAQNEIAPTLTAISVEGQNVKPRSSGELKKITGLKPSCQSSCAMGPILSHVVLGVSHA